MANEQWQKAGDVFDAVLHQTPENRLKFIEEICGANLDLCLEINLLLASHNQAEDFLETPAIEKVAEVIADNNKFELGKSFAHYKIIKPIGAGSFN